MFFLVLLIVSLSCAIVSFILASVFLLKPNRVQVLLSIAFFLQGYTIAHFIQVYQKYILAYPHFFLTYVPCILFFGPCIYMAIQIQIKDRILYLKHIFYLALIHSCIAMTFIKIQTST